MQSTDLGNKESGKIWHRKPSPATHDGSRELSMFPTPRHWGSRCGPRCKD
uniref:TBC1 domain family, member 31 n=1 Tax=Mus musculus TaxID=10090 RepID=E0CYF4_MOUSE